MRGFLLAAVALVGCVAACGIDTSGLGAAGEDAASDSAGSADGSASFDGQGANDSPASDEAPGDGPGARPDGGAGKDTGAIDARVDGSSMPDAGDACAATENCTNGVDDDCDGLTDCADPACQAGYECSAAAAPAGWQIVAFDENGRAGCASGYGDVTNIVEGPQGASATCACTCGAPQGNPCTSGTLSFSIGATGCGCATVAPPSDGSCDPMPSLASCPMRPTGLASISRTPSSGTCSEQASLPAVTYSAQGQSCTPSAQGAGCGGAACVARPPSGGAVCVEQAGDVACPASFATRHLVALDPATLNDTRSCSSCGCAASVTGCTGGSLALFKGPGCGTPVATVAADGTCHNAGTDLSVSTHFIYSAQTSWGACAAAGASNVTGTLAFASPITICCP